MLIGGHAVNAYGISRQTGDVDLVAQRSVKEQWLALLKRLKYQVSQSDDRFARFRPETLAAWPIDLMFVDDQTFAKLLADSQVTKIGVATVRVVSARHLATLKIHALKHYQEHRHLKDYNDLVALLRLERTGISESELRALCERYASIDLFDKIKRELKS